MISLYHIISTSVDTLTYLQNINENLEAVKHIVDTSNSAIANELNVVNILLVTFTIVFGLVGIGLGLYITWLQRKVSKMRDDIEKKEHTIITLAQKIEDTDKKIQSDISGLYKQLREEETITLLRRLEEEPQDISNLDGLLLARSISIEGFPILKSAYTNLLKAENDQKDVNLFDDCKGSYLILFFQHFLYESLLDDDIREDLRKAFEIGCQCAFKRDILKSTKDLCMLLSESDAPFEKEPMLVDYLKAINQSKYKDLIELKNIFQDEIKNQNLLVEAIEKCTTDKVYLSLFGIEEPNETKK